MPTYSYACTQCDHRFDVQQSFSDDALTVCPECAGRLRKVFGNVGVVFKGSGFYRNDARTESSARRSAKDGAGDTSGTSGTGGKDSAGSSSTGSDGSGSGGSSTGTSSSSTPATAGTSSGSSGSGPSGSSGGASSSAAAG